MYFDQHTISEVAASETHQSLLERGKADHLPLQAYEVAEFAPRALSGKHSKWLIAGAVLALIAIGRLVG